MGSCHQTVEKFGMTRPGPTGACTAPEAMPRAYRRSRYSAARGDIQIACADREDVVGAGVGRRRCRVGRDAVSGNVLGGRLHQPRLDRVRSQARSLLQQERRPRPTPPASPCWCRSAGSTSGGRAVCGGRVGRRRNDVAPDIRPTASIRARAASPPGCPAPPGRASRSDRCRSGPWSCSWRSDRRPRRGVHCLHGADRDHIGLLPAK